MSPGDLDAGPESPEHDHRRTAAEWHGGQNTPLYAYASTGSVLPRLDRGIQDCIRQVEAGQVDRDTDPERDLERLTAFLHHVEPLLAIRDAADIGREHGEAAAEWWHQDTLGGRASGDTLARARSIDRGLRDGDPLVLDALPGPRADYGQPELEDDCDWPEPEPDDWAAHARWEAARPHIRDTYEDAFNSAVEEKVAHYCQTELLDARWQRIEATRSAGLEGVRL